MVIWQCMRPRPDSSRSSPAPVGRRPKMAQSRRGALCCSGARRRVTNCTRKAATHHAAGLTSARAHAREGRGAQHSRRCWSMPSTCVSSTTPSSMASVRPRRAPAAACAARTGAPSGTGSSPKRRTASRRRGGAQPEPECGGSVVVAVVLSSSRSARTSARERARAAARGSARSSAATTARALAKARESARSPAPESGARSPRRRRRGRRRGRRRERRGDHRIDRGGRHRGAQPTMLQPRRTRRGGAQPPRERRSRPQTGWTRSAR